MPDLRTTRALLAVATVALGATVSPNQAVAQPVCLPGTLSDYHALADGCMLGGLRLYGIGDAVFVRDDDYLISYLPDALSRVRINPLPVLPGANQVGFRVEFPGDLTGNVTVPNRLAGENAWFYLRLGTANPDWHLYGGSLGGVVGSFSSGTGWTGWQLVSMQRYAGGPGAMSISLQKPMDQPTPVVTEACYQFNSPCSFLPFGGDSDAYLKIEAAAVSVWGTSIDRPAGSGPVTTRLTSFDVLLNVSQPAPQVVTPEPDALALLGSGLLVLGSLVAARRRGEA
jgi:hypothetical protein